MNELNMKEFHDFITLYWQVVKKHFSLNPSNKVALAAYMEDVSKVMEALGDKNDAFFFAGDCFASYIEYRKRVTEHERENTNRAC